jgi:hypothetical protein
LVLTRLTKCLSKSPGMAVVILALVFGSCSEEVPRQHATGNALFKELNYNKPGLSIYSVRVTSLIDSLSRQDTIGLFTTGEILPRQDSQYAMQWQFLTKASGNYKLVDSLYDNSSTGLKIEDSLVYIHPPRHRHLQILQFAPHPLLRVFDKRKHSYFWDLAIGKTWSYPPLFAIDSVDTFKFAYKIERGLDSDGKSACIISGLCSSRFGESIARYYFKRVDGLVRMEYVVPGKEVVTMELIERGGGDVAQVVNPSFYKVQGYRGF